MVKPVVVFGKQIWAVIEMDMKGMGTWERKILRRIYVQWLSKKCGE
jgi:hypothetical protein